jgi:hypothetical protein
MRDEAAGGEGEGDCNVTAEELRSADSVEV